MESIRHFVHKFVVQASMDRVIAFHEDPHTLKILTPPPVFVTFNESILTTENSIADFNLWFGPFPVYWVAQISYDASVSGFIDRQVNCPFEYWEHKHTFQIIDSESTQVIDQVSAKPGGKFFNGLISRVMWITLPLLFTYRAWRTCRELEKKA